MKEFIGYIYFDRTRSWESYFSTDAHWADGDEDWYLGGTVRTLDDVTTVLASQGFDDEYIYHFIEEDISHYDYNMLECQHKELYNNMLDYIVESVGKSNAVDVLRAIGFTDEEIIACGVQIGEEELI